MLGLVLLIRYVPLGMRTSCCHAPLAPRPQKRSTAQKAKSIRTHGILPPLLVQPLNECGFEIIAGARRYRAAQIAGTESAPVRVVNLRASYSFGPPVARG